MYSVADGAGKKSHEAVFAKVNEPEDDLVASDPCSKNSTASRLSHCVGLPVVSACTVKVEGPVPFRYSTALNVRTPSAVDWSVARTTASEP